MSEFIKLFWGTVLLRPYVFAFLACYIVAAWAHIGIKRTLVYVPLGYALAWLSEFCSIHWGFPYGDYYYIHSTVGRELWVFGVPFMDSLSYVFLSYCSYSLALFLMSPISFQPRNLLVLETPRTRQSWQVLVVGAFLFVMLDIIIDPVALLGDRWFLGKIYGYRHVGYYFGIPMSNFGGWLIVGMVLVGALQTLDRLSALDSTTSSLLSRVPFIRLLGPILYFSVLLFNIFVTFRIGQNLLGSVDLVLLTCLMVFIFAMTSYKRSHTLPGQAGTSIRTSRASVSYTSDQGALLDPAHASNGDVQKSG